jgi:hypothetical protein
MSFAHIISATIWRPGGEGGGVFGGAAFAVGNTEQRNIIRQSRTETRASGQRKGPALTTTTCGALGGV